VNEYTVPIEIVIYAPEKLPDMAAANLRAFLALPDEERREVLEATEDDDTQAAE